MTLNRHAKKRDANEIHIIRTLQKVGASVQRLNEKGCPDLLVGFRGRNYIIEVKNPKGKNTITEDQQRWLTAWQGEAYIVTSPQTALEIIGAVECI